MNYCRKYLSMQMRLKLSFERMATFYLKVLEGFHAYDLWRKGITFFRHACVLFSSHYVPNQLVRCFLKNFKNRNKRKCIVWLFCQLEIVHKRKMEMFCPVKGRWTTVLKGYLSNHLADHQRACQISCWSLCLPALIHQIHFFSIQLNFSPSKGIFMPLLFGFTYRPHPSPKINFFERKISSWKL